MLEKYKLQSHALFEGKATTSLVLNLTKSTEKDSEQHNKKLSLKN